MNIERTTIDEFFTGNGSADAEAKPIVAVGYAPSTLYKGVRVRAEHDNTGVLYVGPSGVSSSTGFPLYPDEEVDVQVNDIHKVYIVATSVDNASQTVTLANFGAGTKFTLAYKGQTTSALAYDAAAATVQTALRALSTIGAGNVDVTGNAGGPFTVEFVGDLAGADAELLVGDAVNERQTIVVTNAISGDKITLTHSGNNTALLAYNAAATEVRDALEALISIGADNVSVTDTTGGWIVEFVNDLADTDVSAITGVGGKNEKQTITVTGAISGDKMVLTFAAESTAELAYNADAADLQAALRGLTGIGAGNCTVTGAGPYLVEFVSSHAKEDMAAITGVAGKNEKQTITASGGTAGDKIIFTLSGQSTSELAYDITGANLQTALRGLTTIGAGNCTVTGDGPYLVEFVSAHAKEDMAMLTAVWAKNERQTVTLTGTAAGDKMVLTFGGQSTSELAYNIIAASLQSALEGLSSVGSGNCLVTGGGPYVVEFVAGLAATDVGAITGTAGKNEKQTITVTSGAAGDKMVLTYDGQSTSELNYDATSAQVATALKALSNIGDSDVGVTDGSPGWVVEFTGTLAKTDVPAITGVAGKNEKQTITVSGGAVGDKIIFTLSGQSTSALAYDITGANLQTALLGLTTIGAGNCTVTGDGPYLVEFVSAHAKEDMAMLTAAWTKNEKQTVTLNGVTSGTFTLTYSGQTTANIDYDATPAEVQEALAGLSNLNNSDLSVTGTTPEWVVEFIGTLAGLDVSALTGDDTNLVGDPATISIVETQKGYGATLSVAIVETAKGNLATVGVVETAKGNLATVGVVETQKGYGATLSVAIVETAKGNTAAVGVVETAKGNTATVTVTESIKGDADATVACVAVGQASDGCLYKWVAE